MRKLVLFYLFVLFIIPTSFSQGKFTYNLSVRELNGAPKNGCEITLVETSSFVRTVYKTNASGTITLELKEEDGKEWMLSVGEMKNYTLLTCPPGSEGSGSGVVTYNPERWNRLNQKQVDRSSLTFEDFPQRLNYNAAPDKSHEILELQIVSEKERPYLGLSVKLVNIAEGISYSAETDADGIARFKIPFNQQFQIDLDGEPDFDYYDSGNRPLKRKITLTY